MELSLSGKDLALLVMAVGSDFQKEESKIVFKRFNNAINQGKKITISSQIFDKILIKWSCDEKHWSKLDDLETLLNFIKISD